MFVLSLSAASAVACGGFFCTPAITPIDQAAEEIVFAVDRVAQTVEMHVEITYAGRSEDFAWVLRASTTEGMDRLQLGGRSPCSDTPRV